MTKITTHTIELSTRGHTHILDITPKVQQLVAKSGLKEGHVLVFVPGSTGGLTTLEYEPGLLKDLPEFLEEIIPKGRRYHHDDTWHDGNGYAHLRAAFIQPDLMVPFVAGELTLGTWQQIVFIDFDNRPRHRRLVVQIWGQ